jgi:hypothetical protein
MPTDFSRVTFDIATMQLTTKSFARKLSVLVEYGDQKKDALTKLQIVNAELKIDNGYLQSLRRWWNGQSRDELYKYLRDELNEYILFLDMTNIALNYHRFDPQFQSIRDKNIDFVQSILPGLNHLPSLYPEHEMLCSTVKRSVERFGKFLERHCCNISQSVLPSILEAQRI